jgi:hypothetical protein
MIKERTDRHQRPVRFEVDRDYYCSMQRPSAVTYPLQESLFGRGAVVSLHAANTKEDRASARRTKGRRDMRAISVGGGTR